MAHIQGKHRLHTPIPAGPVPGGAGADAEDWYIPLCEEEMTLADALASLHRAGDGQDDIPVLVQLVENPRFRVPGVDVFHGRVDLFAHDCIHVALGRGMAPKDEAFVIGFTMGSTNRVGAAEEGLFAFIAGNLYPGVYKFSDEDLAVFRDALRLGQVSDCTALDTVDFRRYLDWPLVNLRRVLGVEVDLLAAYYRIEARRYPQAPESQRLLSCRRPA